MKGDVLEFEVLLFGILIDVIVQKYVWSTRIVILALHIHGCIETGLPILYVDSLSNNIILLKLLL